MSDPEHAGGASEGSGPAPAVKAPRLDVLVIDAALAVAQTTSEVLRSAGLFVVAVTGFADAAGILEAHRVGTIVLDQAAAQREPRIVELARSRAIPVVAVSALGPEALDEMARSSNGTVVAGLTKPAAPTRLIDAVRSALASRTPAGFEAGN